MKQATLTGEKLSMSEWGRIRNKRRAPDKVSVWAGCVGNHCTVFAPAAQVEVRREPGYVVFNCYCACHGAGPSEEYVMERFAYPENDEGSAGVEA